MIKSQPTGYVTSTKPDVTRNVTKVEPQATPVTGYVTIEQFQQALDRIDELERRLDGFQSSVDPKRDRSEYMREYRKRSKV